MRECISAGGLLAEARRLFDAPDHALARSAQMAWRGGFDSGGRWMGQVLEALRGRPPAGPVAGLQFLGTAKYALATVPALACVLAAFLLRMPAIALLSIVAFYAAEAQWVFLIPLALDGELRPFRQSRHWTTRAGGTLAVMRIVLILAATMLLGGFAGRGFVRSWCLGCIAVCVWYETLRNAAKV